MTHFRISRRAEMLRDAAKRAKMPASAFKELMGLTDDEQARLFDLISRHATREDALAALGQSDA